MLHLYVDGMPEMNILADIPRQDVQSAGLGPLRCGFDTALPRRLRDGRAHRVELRFGLDGPVLRRGRLDIAAAAAGRAVAADGDIGEEDETPGGASPLAETGRHEGVAFLDSRNAAIAGWATGCRQVTVVFDGGLPGSVLLDREVPGFGSGSRQGFRLPVPAALHDGEPHRAEVFFDTGDRPLDGTPVHFLLARERPFVEVESLSGQELVLVLRDAGGHRVTAPVTVLADGIPLAAGDESGRLRVRLPAATAELLVGDAAGTPLARFSVAGGRIAEAPHRELPPEALSDAGCATAREAFAAFCAEPDGRFEPLWYSWQQPATWGLEDRDALLAHYGREGAAAGIGPGPRFDETAARALHPQIAAAIAAGRLPCAFAVELHLGRGSLGSLDHLGPRLARRLSQPSAGQDDGAEDSAGRAGEQALDGAFAAEPPAPAPIVARLPPPSFVRPASSAIYAAWLARLVLSDEARQELERDEQEMRREIAGTALTRTPLVSIIMPSYNRAFTIGEAIQSVLDQSYANWELIVSDDASEDRTAEVVRGFDDPRIRYMKFLKSNGAGTRNKGLRNARGDYIAYLDSDNLWHPQFLDMMLRRLLGAPGTAIAYCAYLDTEITGAQVTLQGVSRPSFRPIRLSAKNFMDLNSIVHHRRVYDWLGGFDNTLPRLQDWDLALRYTSIFRPIFVNHAGVFYRRNAAWGQVTHLFMESGAQDTVNEKTRRRLEEAHERLGIAWSDRGRVTVLCGAGASAQERAMARSLAGLAAEVTAVDLLMPGSPEEDRAAGEGPAAAGPAPAGADAPGPETNPDTDPARESGPAAAAEAEAEPGTAPAAAAEGLLCHVLPPGLQDDPVRFGQALWGLLQGRPLLTLGCSGDMLRAIPGLDPAQVWRLRRSGEGSVLQNLGEPRIRFDIGALPLDLPQGPHDPAALTVLVLPPPQRAAERDRLTARIAAEAERRGLTALLPPRSGSGEWQVLGRTGPRVAPAAAGTLPALLGQCAMTVCMTPVPELDPFGLALVNALQARGVPAAVLQDAGRARATGFARQWIEARAAYEIQVDDPRWIFDKIRKLLGDRPGLERMQERSRTVHRIAFHPDLARERLAHALYRMLHDRLEREVIDGRA